jgi:hypothetical protein
MNGLITYHQSLITTARQRPAFILIAPLLASLAFSPMAQAVSPPPGGGYPNFTTAEGQNALLHLTTGAANTALGWFSLDSVTTGSFNTAVGAGTLLSNTGDENTAVGTAALLLNTASGNTAVGSKALLNNTTGGTLENVQGLDVGPNVAVGEEALESNTVASANTAVGYQALHSFTSGPMGFEHAGLCTAIGFQALANATPACFLNSAFGYQALVNNTAGDSNTAIGTLTLRNCTTGGGNTALGTGAGWGVSTASGVICIGSNIQGENVDNSCYIRNIWGSVLPDGVAVVVNQSERLGTVTSSRRFKENIKPMKNVSNSLFSLNPVAFRYKKEIDPKGTRQLGLVAEEVEKVNPDLVVHDKEGKPYSVRYEQVNAMLLNEFLKEHKKVQQLEATVEQQRDDFETTIAELKKEMNSVVARFEDSKTEKMGAQMQITRRGRQIVLNNPQKQKPD